MVASYNPNYKINNLSIYNKLIILPCKNDAEKL